jgi:hypothetical protein
MIVDFKFEIGKTVFYLDFDESFLGHDRLCVKERNIFGFSYTEKHGIVDIRVDFKGRNGVPFEYVFKTKEEAEIKLKETSARTYYK